MACECGVTVSIFLGNPTFPVDGLSSHKVCEFSLALDYVCFMATLNYVQRGVSMVTNKGGDKPSTGSSVTSLPFQGNDVECFQPY